MIAPFDISALERAALAVTGWSSCNQAWLDASEDVAAAVVGHIDEEGNAYPVATIDCDQYYSGDSLPLAKFYAAANPAVALELVRRLREAEKQRDELLAAFALSLDNHQECRDADECHVAQEVFDKVEAES